MKVKFTFLVDDGAGENLKNEHGLSILIELNNTKILFDTGWSGCFAENAEALGLDLGNVDFAMVSHGHYDHGGGLPSFFKKNSTASVFMHSKAALPIYYGTDKDAPERSESEHYIGINPEIFKTDNERFSFIDTACSPVEGIHIIPCTDIDDRGPIFRDNSLFIRDRQGKHTETFDHEIFMIIERENDYIIVSGCSHNNIIKIVEHGRKLFKTKSMAGVIGGFHLPDVKTFTDAHSKAITSIADRLDEIAAEEHIHPLFYTGHCTGDRAKIMLKEKLGEDIDFFHTGYEILL